MNTLSNSNKYAFIIYNYRTGDDAPSVLSKTPTKGDIVFEYHEEWHENGGAYHIGHKAKTGRSFRYLDTVKYSDAGNDNLELRRQSGSLFVVKSANPDLKLRFERVDQIATGNLIKE